MEDIRTCIERSPKKSMWKLAHQAGVGRRTWYVLKQMHMNPYCVTAMQKLKESDKHLIYFFLYRIWVATDIDYGRNLRPNVVYDGCSTVSFIWTCIHQTHTISFSSLACDVSYPLQAAWYKWHACRQAKISGFILHHHFIYTRTLCQLTIKETWSNYLPNDHISAL